MTSYTIGPFEYVSQKKTSDTNLRKNFGMYKSIYKLFKLVLQPVLLKKGRKMSQPKSLSTYVIFSNFWDGIHALKIKIEWEKLAVDTHLNLRVQNDYILHKYFLENILILVAKNKGIFSIF